MAAILLIEDEPDLRDVIAQILRRAGHTVDEAPDGRTGLARYVAGRHDLIITDIVMPDMEGLELIAKLRSVSPRPRIIAVSGNSRFSQSVYLPTALRLGVQRTLAKPVRPEVLVQTVAEVLAAPAPPAVPDRGTNAPPASGWGPATRPSPETAASGTLPSPTSE